MRTLVVIGGGAAGIFCAVNAARMKPDLQVILLEKTNKLLSKVRISGGGRCNVTHACFNITEMSKRYPRGYNFVKKTFHRFFTTDTIQWFEEREVELKTEDDGRMFPITDSSETIIRCLMNDVNRFGVDVRMHAEVRSVEIIQPGEQQQFSIEVSGQSKIIADYVCIATGGYPKGAMFSWIKSLGHTVVDPLPSLFTFNTPKHPITQLMGVSVPEVKVKIEGTKLTEEGPLLITHWGFSGPAILKLSAVGARELAAKQYVFKVHINWVPAFNDQTLKEKLQAMRKIPASKKLQNQNFTALPQRLWEFMLKTSGIGDEMRMNDLPAKLENALIRNLVDYTVEVSGKTTFKEEFVTAGGVQLSEVDPNTMISRKVPQLYFAGEVLDIDGVTGGFNFQNAWTTGWIVAEAVSKAYHTSTGSV